MAMTEKKNKFWKQIGEKIFYTYYYIQSFWYFEWYRMQVKQKCEAKPINFIAGVLLFLSTLTIGNNVMLFISIIII
jgi:hypothetical protein